MAVTPLVRPASGNITVDAVTSEAAFDALCPEWDRLVDSLDLPSPFHSWAWNRLWWKHFGHGRSLLILVFRDGGDLLGIAPYYRRSLRFGPVKLSFLLPLGWEGNGRSNGLTEQWELLFPVGFRPQLLLALGRWLQDEQWSGILLPGLRHSDRLPGWLAERVVVKGQRVEFHYRDLSPTWEEFLKELNKSMRDNVKYYPRRMQRMGKQYRFEVASAPGDVLTMLPTLFDLHRARAEAKMRVPHRDYFRYPDRRAFIREVSASLAADGLMKIGVLFVSGEAVAAQMWMECHNVMFLYYSGYLPTWASYGVGLVATVEALKDAIGRGVQRVEFLTGGGQLKERWGTSRRFHGNVSLIHKPGVASSIMSLPIPFRRLM